MHLSQHQRAILKLLQSGHSYRTAGKALGISKECVAANLTWVAKKNKYSSVTALRKAAAVINLDQPNIKRTHIAGIRKTEAGTFRAVISLGKRQYKHLGTFRTREQAIAARLKAEKEYRGTTVQRSEDNRTGDQ
jgi:DNA-binding CsgD family transcriptional regulator